MQFKGLTASAILIVAASPLAAEELCVICSDPPAAYRCDSGASAASGAGFQLLCVKQIATRGGHKSCTIDRTRANIQCNGVLVTVDQPHESVAPAALPPPTNAASPVESAVPSPIPAQTKNTTPDTMEALAKETADQSKKEWDATNAKVQESTQAASQNLKKAGGAVGDAVKKSWNCVISLFSSC